jgi:hypothetical protein
VYQFCIRNTRLPSLWCHHTLSEAHKGGNVRIIEARSCKCCANGKAISARYCECVCSPRYPACNTHAPYCHLWPAPLYTIFPHYLINVTILGGKNVIDDKMRVSLFSTTVVWNIFHSKKNWARYLQNSIVVFTSSNRCSCQVLTKLEISRHIFENT